MGSSQRYGKGRSIKKKGFCCEKKAKPDVNLGKRKHQQDSSFDSTTAGTSNQNESFSDMNMSSASSKKLGIDFSESSSEVHDAPECTLFMNSDVLLSMFYYIGRCPDCVAAVSIEHVLSQKKGLAHLFLIKCSECDWSTKFCTSKEILSTGRGTKGYEINTAAVVTFREIGHGYQALETFCGMMNMPPPMNKNSFYRTSSNVHTVYLHTSRQSMKKAADEIRGSKENVIVDTRVSIDGSWQKRGYNSIFMSVDKR